MPKVLGGLLLSALFLIAVPPGSYAMTCGCAGPGMREAASANEGMRHHDAGIAMPGHRMWKQLGRLDLDEKQKEATREIWSTFMKGAVSKTADVRIARIELRDILAKDTVDMHAVEAKLKEIASLQTELRFSRIKAMEDVKAKLTPEQRKKFREGMEKQWISGRSGRWGHGGREMAAPGGACGKMMPPPMDRMDD